MNVAGDEEDRFAFSGERIDLLRSEAAGIGKLVRDVFVVGFVAQVFFGRDYGHEHVFAERGFAKDFQFDSI